MGSVVIAVGVVIVLCILVGGVAYRDGYRQGVDDASAAAKTRARLLERVR